MTTARGNFGTAQLGGRLLAFGGWDGNDALDSTEEWDEELEQWVAREERLQTERRYFGFVSAPVAMVCK